MWKMIVQKCGEVSEVGAMIKGTGRSLKGILLRSSLGYAVKSMTHMSTMINTQCLKSQSKNATQKNSGLWTMI